jgi:hypothetical protein
MLKVAWFGSRRERELRGVAMVCWHRVQAKTSGRDESIATPSNCRLLGCAAYRCLTAGGLGRKRRLYEDQITPALHLQATVTENDWRTKRDRFACASKVVAAHTRLPRSSRTTVRSARVTISLTRLYRAAYEKADVRL